MGREAPSRASLPAMKRRYIGGIVAAAAILTSLVAPVAAFEPASEGLPAPSDRALLCGLSSSGQWAVMSNATNDGWTRWSASTGPSEAGDGRPISAVRISDNGNLITSASMGAALGDRIEQVEVSTRQVDTIVENADLVAGFGASHDGGHVTWLQVFDPTGPDTLEVRSWDRLTDEITVHDVRSTVDISGPRRTVTSANAQFIRVAWNRLSTTSTVYDTVDGTSFELRPPPGTQFPATLTAISGNGLRYLWAVGGEEMIVADRNGRRVADVPTAIQVSLMDDRAAFLRSNYFFSEDGQTALVIGGELTDEYPGSRIVVQRWNVASGTVDDIDLPGATAFASFEVLAERSSSICAVSSDLRYVVHRGRLTPDGPVELRRYDLSRPAPRQITTDEVTGPQLTDQIRRLYRAYLQRDPDGGGLAHWRDERARGVLLSQVSNAFASSDEFIQRYGNLTNREFVLQIYDDVLDRTADEPGVAFWTAVLDSGVSRGDVMIGFSEAPEFVAVTGTTPAVHDPRVASLNRLYQAFLTRDGDGGGLTFWFDLLVRNQASLIDTATSFADSAEFEVTYGALGNEAFVDLVYENVLGRPGEPDGRAFWIALLEQGVTRGEVMLAFSESPEFVLKTDSIPPS